MTRLLRWLGDIYWRLRGVRRARFRWDERDVIVFKRRRK